ncbi:hypothetical protein LA5095_01940 [Roseibium album]|uniref:PH domain-containing protein n=2 Tax=Roseibium album TaxID=311410 RepID=A0A0M6ZTQ2_9HYPH|nr:hypothetical protein LA5094_00885 [Roseibium album]CTQ65632.1 hypothetical protein LA5096_00796 [Roseibium album]CTQ70506.1 hypothetical protein LA5095_01940 [Roseibium album]
MGKTAKIEFIRRVLPLSLSVFAIVCGFFFMSLLNSLLCLVAAAGIYAALPKPSAPSGAVKPVCRPSIIVFDALGFTLGILFFSLAFIGMGSTTGALALISLCLLVPACACFPFFAVAVRQETSWVRFFGNGFEFTQFGLRARVPYDELKKVEVRLWEASGWVAWFQSTMGSIGHKKAVLLNGAESTKTLVFKHPANGTFTISSELIPDLQRILIGMDRAGIELPEGISEWQRKKIRRRRERMYGEPEKEAPKSEQVEVARIAALIEHARRQTT